MEKNNDKPKLRFPGFTDPWEQRKLGVEALEMVAGGDINKYKISTTGKYPVVANALTNDGIVGYYKDEFRIKAPAVTVTGRGDVGHAKARKVDFTPVVRVLSIKSNHDVDFLEKAINNHKVMIESTGVPQLTVPQLAKYEIYFPKYIDEEKIIGAFFRNYDNLITLHQRKLIHLQDKKKGLLQKMFPKNGEDFPELRFPGFTDPWEQRKLGEMSDSLEYGLNAAATEFDGENKYIRITDIDDESRRFLNMGLTSPNVDLSNADKYILKSGDILLARTGASVGKSYIYKEYDGLVYYAGFLIRARIKPEYYAEFVFQSTLTNGYNKYIRITSQRSGQPGVNAQEYAEFNLRVPKYDEQLKVGVFFRNLDNLITLHQRKLNHIKEQKKSFLQQMFI